MAPRWGLLGLVCGVMVLASSGNKSRATPERLAELRADGLDTAAADRAEQRLERLLERDAVASLEGPFGTQAPDAGAAELGQLLVAALERNASLGDAAQDIDRADAERLNAVFGYLPQVNFEYTQSDVDQTVLDSDNAVFLEGEANYPVLNYSLLVNQPIIDMGRIFGIQYARNARSVAEVNYLAAVRDVTFEVADAYLVALQAQRQSGFLRQRQGVVNAQISSRVVLADIGLGDEIAESSLLGEAASIAAQEANEAAREAEALGRLAFLTGTTVSELATISLPAGIRGTERQVSPDQAVARGFENNPTIMAAALMAVGGEIDRRRALAEDFAPVLTAFAALEYEDRDASRFGGGSETEDVTIGLTLRVPLFNGNAQGYSFRPATIEGRSMVLEYHAARRQLETELRATHARMVELSRAIGSGRQAVGQAQRALAAERQRVLSGESVELAVAGRQVRLNVLRAQTDLYEMEYFRAWLRLQYLMGVDLAEAGLCAFAGLSQPW